MSKTKHKSPENAVFKGFSGIDTRFDHSGTPRTADICNFRIRDDLSLEKRHGYRFLTSLDSEIRAVWTGVIQGEEKCFLLCDDTIYLYDGETKETIPTGYVDNSVGKGCFFYHRDRLYVADGKNIYEIDPQTQAVSKTVGYIPLIGKNWRTAKRGEIYEPRNLLCDRGRITYKAEEYPLIYLHTGWLASSIDAVYLNGNLVDPSDYYYNPSLKSIELYGIVENDEVTAYVTYASPEDNKLTEGLFSCTAVLNFGDLYGDRIFMWGGNKQNTLYCSEFVSNTSMEASLMADKRSSQLYFPVGYEFAAGDGRHEVRAAIRHYDRLLVFTESDAWNADPTASGLKDLPLASINSGAGCVSMCAVSMAGNSPVSVGKHTIYSWSSDTDEYNESNAVSISGAIDALLSENFYRNAIVFNAKKYGEVWFHAFGENNTWIYNVKNKMWYRFTGFDAQGFFELGSNVCFYNKDGIYAFDDELVGDVPADSTTKPISANYGSAILEFSTPEKKRLNRIILRADTHGSELSVRVFTDTLFPLSFSLPETIGDHGIINKRLHSGRFHYAAFRIFSQDLASPVIHSAELHVR